MSLLALGCAGEKPPLVAKEPVSPPVRVVTEPWLRFKEVEGFPLANGEAFPSRGHLVSPSYAIVRTSPDARSAYLALVADSALPDGSVVAMFHQSHDGARAGPVYVMEKQASRWTFLALDAGGSPFATDLDACQRCHELGAADDLFGLPRALGGATPAATFPPVPAELDRAGGR